MEFVFFYCCKDSFSKYFTLSRNIAPSFINSIANSDCRIINEYSSMEIITVFLITQKINHKENILARKHNMRAMKKYNILSE
jgi:hypothetical protein